MIKPGVYNTNGFTLIELVIAIVIVGILAAAALPRFSNLSNQANTASNQAMAGQFRSAVGVMHAAWIAAGAPNNNPLSTTITIESGGVGMGSTGWPDGASNSNVTASTCAAAFNDILSNPPQVVTSGCSQTPCYIASQNGSGLVPGPNWICVYTLYLGSTAAVPAHYISYNMGTGAVVAY